MKVLAMKITASSYRAMPDALWRRLHKLLPKPRPRPKGGRRPLDQRRVADGIYFVMRTGCPWKAAPKEYGSGSSLHRYFQAWCDRGVFGKLWKLGLVEYDRRRGIGWRWQTLDTAMNKAPLGGGKPGQIRPIVASWASSARCSPMLAASSWVWRSDRPIATTSSWPYRRLIVCRYTGRSHDRSTCAPTKRTMPTTFDAAWNVATIVGTSSRVGRKHAISVGIHTPRLNVGSMNGNNPGSTDFIDS